MSFILPDELRKCYIRVLDRAQAFELCGRGAEHDKFMPELNDQLKSVHTLIVTHDYSSVTQKMNTLNECMDKMYIKYDYITQVDIIEFIQSRHDTLDIETSINEINARDRELKEMWYDLVNRLAVSDETTVNRLNSIDKRLKIICKQPDNTSEPTNQTNCATSSKKKRSIVKHLAV